MSKPVTNSNVNSTNVTPTLITNSIADTTSNPVVDNTSTSLNSGLSIGGIDVPNWAYGVAAAGITVMAGVGVSVYHFVSRDRTQKEARRRVMEIVGNGLVQNPTPRTVGIDLEERAHAEQAKRRMIESAKRELSQSALNTKAVHRKHKHNADIDVIDDIEEDPLEDIKDQPTNHITNNLKVIRESGESLSDSSSYELEIPSRPDNKLQASPKEEQVQPYRIKTSVREQLRRTSMNILDISADAESIIADVVEVNSEALDEKIVERQITDEIVFSRPELTVGTEILDESDSSYEI